MAPEQKATVLAAESPKPVVAQSPVTSKSSLSKRSDGRKAVAIINKDQIFYDRKDVNDSIRANLMKLFTLPLFPEYNAPEFTDDGQP